MKEDEFLEKIELHQAMIHRICQIYRDSREDREDLFQEIVYQLWKSLSRFRGESKFSSWIYRIGLNTAMASFRKPAIKVLPDAEITPSMESTIPPLENPRQELLFAAIRQLDEAERAIITLYLEDMRYQEMATILGITENNLGVRLNRIKKKLKQILLPLT